MLTDNEIRMAAKWQSQHSKFVDALLTDAGKACPPTGSVVCRPELWKPAHWKWFIEQIALHKSFERSFKQALAGETQDVETLWDDENLDRE